MAGEFDIALRWLHFVAGITWIGLLYFFNFVNVPFQKELDADIKPKVNPKLLPRTLWWFRHAAWVTVLVGLVMFWRFFDMGVYTADNTQAISLGGLLGVLMMLNVWGVIWPNQKKILNAMATGQKPDAKWAKNALMASRANVMMSFPMLFFMAAQSHLAGYDWAALLGIGVALAAVAFLLLWWVQMRPAAAATPPPKPAGGPTK